jgi:hypothetical protein
MKLHFEMSKKRAVILAVLLIAVVACALVAYASLTITSNTVIVTPQSIPIITLSINSTSPYVGVDTLRLTATLNATTSGIQVSFLSNGTVINPIPISTNVNGVALLDVLVTTYDVKNITAIAIIP